MSREFHSGIKIICTTPQDDQIKEKGYENLLTLQYELIILKFLDLK